MEARRAYRHRNPHRQTPEAKRKTARKSRIAAYGLTPGDFASLLAEQGATCAMCHEGFKGGQAQALRDEIERTREHLGDTVEQLAAKANVKTQAQAEAAQLGERVRVGPRRHVGGGRSAAPRRDEE